MNLAGVGLIMSDVGIEFKNELFYGDLIKASVATDGFSKIRFDIFINSKRKLGENIPVVIAKNRDGML
jgi:hypothetical protein